MLLVFYARTMPKLKSDVVDSPVATVGVSDVEQIVQKAVEAAVTVVRNEFEKRFQDMNARLQSLEDKLETFCETTEQRQAESQSTVLRDELVRLSTELETARKDARDAIVAANDAEQYNRRNNLRIRGLSVQRDDNCRHKVVEFIRTNLNLVLNEDDIEAAHTLPSRKRAPGSAAQPATSRGEVEPTIIVRFRNRDLRDKIIRNRRNLKGTNRAIVDDLTSLNVQLMNRLRNHPLVSKVWSWNGRVTALTNSGHVIHVKPFQTVQDCLVS